MHRDFPLKLKALTDNGTFTGYASTYGPPADLVGDVIAQGAFKQAIQQQGAGYPLLFAHDQSQPLGVAKVADSQGGLLVGGQLVMEDPAAQRAYSHLRAGSLRGLSIGFTAPEGRTAIQSDGSRLLKEIRLHEISLVACPANPAAHVFSVKDASRILAGVKAEHLSAEDRGTLAGLLKRLVGAKNALCQCGCTECLAGTCADCGDPSCTDLNCEGHTVPDELLAELRAIAANLKR